MLWCVCVRERGGREEGGGEEGEGEGERERERHLKTALKNWDNTITLKVIPDV